MRVASTRSFLCEDGDNSGSEALPRRLVNTAIQWTQTNLLANERRAQIAMSYPSCVCHTLFLPYHIQNHSMSKVNVRYPCQQRGFRVSKLLPHFLNTIIERTRRARAIQSSLPHLFT